MNESQASTLKMIVHMNDHFFARIHEGKLNHAKDVKSLLSYVDMAKKLEASVVAGWVMLTVGIAHTYVGKLDHSIERYDEAYALFKEADDQVHMAAAINNTGEAYRVQGIYDKALDLYEKAIQLAENTPQDYVHPISPLTRDGLTQILISNKGLTLMSLGRYDEAEVSFEKALAQFEGQTRANLDSMCEIRRGLAEVYLSQDKLRDAYSSVRLAQEAAENLQNNVVLGDVFLTMAHILDADPNAEESATDYYQRSRDLVESTSLPVLIARSLMDEARYQQRKGNIEKTQSLATEAYDMFVKFEMEEEAQLAHVLMGA